MAGVEFQFTVHHEFKKKKKKTQTLNVFSWYTPNVASYLIC